MTTITPPANARPATTAVEVEQVRARAVAAMTDYFLAYRDLAAEGGDVAEVRHANACADELLTLAAAISNVGSDVAK